MKKRFTILFYLTLSQFGFSQTQEECLESNLNTTPVVLSGDVYDYQLESCTAEVKVTTNNENTIIHGITLVDAIESINIKASENYQVIIKPNDPLDFIGFIATEDYITFSDMIDPLAPGNSTDYGNIDIIDKKDYEITLYPNPVTVILNIDTTQTIVYYKIVDLYGVTMMEGETLSENRVSVKSLTSGLYYIILKTHEYIYIEPFNKN